MPRTPIVFPIRFAAGAQAIQTTTRELSAEGVFVRSLQPPEPGTQVALRMYLPGHGEADDALGVVRGVREHPESGFWAEFVTLDAEVSARIHELLQRRATAAKAGPATPIGAVKLKRSDDTRRAFPRYEARFQVGWSTVQDFVLEYAANISVGGVFVQTETPPELDQIVTVSLSLPGSGTPVETKGVIVHRVTREQADERNVVPGMGVQFLDSSDEFRGAIERAIDHILKHG
jgi:type IV pilus assembly protein PilZ